jgi:hypothetical protein
MPTLVMASSQLQMTEAKSGAWEAGVVTLQTQATWISLVFYRLRFVTALLHPVLHLI